MPGPQLDVVPLVPALCTPGPGSLHHSVLELSALTLSFLKQGSQHSQALLQGGDKAYSRRGIHFGEHLGELKTQDQRA